MTLLVFDNAGEINIMGQIWKKSCATKCYLSAVDTVA